MSQTKILVIEDEPDLREGLQHNLEMEGYSVDTAADGSEGLEKALNGNPDLVLLDLMLPAMPGLDVLKRLRKDGRPTPVIIVSAKGLDREKVAGLELGADDYIAKPFGLSELSARIRAVLRRTRSARESAAKPIHRFRNLTIDFTRFTATRDGVEHQLSKFEAEILRMLVEHRGEVVSRQDLLRKVWGYVHLPTTRTVDNHIARLRKKIEHDVDKPVHIITVHGLGYRFDSEPLEGP
ncbi:MAG: response regulator transcription factor [Planctomycetota bacterium]